MNLIFLSDWEDDYHSYLTDEINSWDDYDSRLIAIVVSWSVFGFGEFFIFLL